MVHSLPHWKEVENNATPPTTVTSTNSSMFSSLSPELTNHPPTAHFVSAGFFVWVNQTNWRIEHCPLLSLSRCSTHPPYLFVISSLPFSSSRQFILLWVNQHYSPHTNPTYHCVTLLLVSPNPTLLFIHQSSSFIHPQSLAVLLYSSHPFIRRWQIIIPNNTGLYYSSLHRSQKASPHPQFFSSNFSTKQAPNRSGALPRAVLSVQNEPGKTLFWTPSL